MNQGGLIVMRKGIIYVYFNRAKYEKEGIEKYYVGQTVRTAEQRARTRSEINNFFILLNISMFFYFRELCCFFGRTTALPFINFNSASKPYNCDNRLSFSISAPP